MEEGEKPVENVVNLKGQQLSQEDIQRKLDDKAKVDQAVGILQRSDIRSLVIIFINEENQMSILDPSKDLRNTIYMLESAKVSLLS